MMASWNSINWVYELLLSNEDMIVLCVISAYSLYLTSIGDIDKALDPMQLDHWSFWSWKWSNHQQFMIYDVAKLTPFGMSILPTPILISSISIATTTAPVICAKIVSFEGAIRIL